MNTSAINPVLKHVIPFIAWIFLMHMLGDPAGWKYAVMSATGIGLMAWLKPWRFYPRMTLANIPGAILLGLAVFALWVAGETAWMATRAPVLHTLYVKWLVLPLGEPRPEITTLPFAPETCGWPLAIIRILGSGLVIGVIEEFFWRGFVLRWVEHQDFLAVDPQKVRRTVFWAVALCFGLEHQEWFVGVLTGAIYAWYYIRTKDLWAAATAHAITNLALGTYVLATRSFQFW